jgi:nitrate/TMAO reductase-like tetraheme cytochrome c subunit
MKKRALLIAAVVGAVIAVIAVLVNEQIDHYTSTEAFCGTSCHSMQAHVANESTYLESAHRTSSSGVLATCADCHIPKGIVPSTWTHVKSGIRDIISETLNDFSKPEVWEEMRPELAYRVRDWLLETDSATCRSCHEEDAIRPERKRGQKQHASAREEGVTCIACHYNLVHAEVEPRESFLEMAEKGNQQ